MKIKKQIIIGLTGGIATGKSTVSKYLSTQYHLPVFDADIIAREAVAINTPILKNISRRYGDKILTVDNNLNRQELGKIIFNNPQEKQWLEQQIHPFVYQSFQKIISQSTAPIIVLVIPLLFEAKMTDLVSQIWVVSCSLEQEIDRLTQRNKLTFTEAMSRIESQIPLNKKVALADIVIDNNGNLKQLYSQIDQLMSSKFYKS